VPELPEVEVVRAGLERHVTGRAVEAVEVHHPRSVRRQVGGAGEFVALASGRRLGAARRRGKYLWVPLHPLSGSRFPADEAVLAHLGMSGQLLVRPRSAPLEPHLRVRLLLDPVGGAPVDLRFVDQRTFGGLSVAPIVASAADGADVPAPVAHIGVDPLEGSFDPAAVSERLRRRRTGVKRALLDQTLLSGVGNIYADESLWRARLHYARPTETLRRAEVGTLLAAVRAVLAEALGQGGTSFDALYVGVDGRAGYFDRSLAVYGRSGQPCPRCGTTVRRDPFMNRSSYTCPHCQPRPRRARW